MVIDPASQSTRENYQLLISCLVPRPIAWVSTMSAEGLHNLAPFSFFGGVTAAPLTMMVSVGRRRGALKDTARNLLAQHQGVVHIPHRPLAEAMVATSAEVPAEVDEFELAHLQHVMADTVQARRLVDAAVAFECRMVRHLELGTGPNDVFFLEAARVHLHESVLGNDGLPDASKLAAVGRLGRHEYSDTEEVFSIPRPSGQDVAHLVGTPRSTK